MAITKETKIAKIEVVGDFKIVQIAADTIIKENGNEISQSRHRKLLTPDMDISNEPADVQAICNTAWTQEVKDNWNTHQSERQSLTALSAEEDPNLGA